MKPAVPEPDESSPGAPVPAKRNDVADVADDALLDSSRDLKTGLQVDDVAESLSNEDFDSLFGGLRR